MAIIRSKAKADTNIEVIYDDGDIDPAHCNYRGIVVQYGRIAGYVPINGAMNEAKFMHVKLELENGANPDIHSLRGPDLPVRELYKFMTNLPGKKALEEIRPLQEIEEPSESESTELEWLRAEKKFQEAGCEYVSPSLEPTVKDIAREQLNQSRSYRGR